VKGSYRPETALSSVERYVIARCLLQSCAAQLHQLAPSRGGTPHELVDEQNLHHQFVAELSACLIREPRASSGFYHARYDHQSPCYGA